MGGGSTPGIITQPTKSSYALLWLVGLGRPSARFNHALLRCVALGCVALHPSLVPSLGRWVFLFVSAVSLSLSLGRMQPS